MPYDYKSLIHIYDDTQNNGKMNSVGKEEHALSLSWMKSEAKQKKQQQKELKAHLTTFFRNTKSANKAKGRLWTTFKDFEKEYAGKGYGTRFLSCNARATNEYKDCDVLAYALNRYFDPNLLPILQSFAPNFDEDIWALSELLQWLFRSALREGKEIWLYIPSSRMRGLLKEWL